MASQLHNVCDPVQQTVTYQVTNARVSAQTTQLSLLHIMLSLVKVFTCK